MQFKHFKLSLYSMSAFCIIAFALLLRFILISQSWPETNSDEGTLGLMALHIAYRGEYPIFFYGQGYMGPLEAYLAACLFHLFGPSLFVLRLGLIILLALFFISTYLLTTLLYNQKLALVTLVILSLGSSGELFVQLRAIGGYAETLLFSSLLLLLATQLAFSYNHNLPLKKRLLRYILYCCWGYLVGVGIWTDLLIMPFVVMSAAFLLILCWPDLDSLAPSCIIGSFTLGILPLLVYNIQSLPQKSTLFYFLLDYRSDTTGQALNQVPFIQKFLGALLVGLPNATGANPICSTQSVPFFGLFNPANRSCVLLQGSWSLGCILLWFCAVILTLRILWKRRHHLRKYLVDAETRYFTVRYGARLMLLGSAALTFILFASSPVAGLDPWTNSRYLLCLLSITPAIIAPLWSEVHTGRAILTRLAKLLPGTSKEPEIAKQDLTLSSQAVPPPLSTHGVSKVRRWAASILSTGVLLYICAMLVLGTLGTFNAIPATLAWNAQQDQLITRLEHMGATRIYSEYWTCNRIIFQSNERIICSVIGDNLRPGYNRYEPYYFIVKRSAPHAFYVLPLGSPVAINFAHRMAHSKKHYRQYLFDGYAIYQPL